MSIIELWKLPSFTTSTNPTKDHIIEGYHKGEMHIDDIVEINHNPFGGAQVRKKIVRVIERRDYKGFFENPEDKINTYYKIEVK